MLTLFQSIWDAYLQTFSWVTFWQGVGCKLFRAVYLAPRPEFQTKLIIRKFITPSTTGIFSWKGCKLTSVNLRCFLQTFSWVMYWQGVGGQAVQSGLSCPPTQNFRENDNPQILFHHLLQEYLVEKEYKLYFSQSKMLTSKVGWVMFWQGMGGKLSRAVYTAPHPEFLRERIICKFYYTIYYRNI